MDGFAFFQRLRANLWTSGPLPAVRRVLPVWEASELCRPMRRPKVSAVPQLRPEAEALVAELPRPKRPLRPPCELLPLRMLALAEAASALAASSDSWTAACFPFLLLAFWLWIEQKANVMKYRIEKQSCRHNWIGRNGNTYKMYQ